MSVNESLKLLVHFEMLAMALDLYVPPHCRIEVLMPAMPATNWTIEKIQSIYFPQARKCMRVKSSARMRPLARKQGRWRTFLQKMGAIRQLEQARTDTT